ncbi:hypothetical protein EYZ11_001173 [Aspergillus tanneri]|uniref:Uncharacterized protein n=1 Tax=Aspergillus tanneri TaxID=1220188 RepID=A0A4S3JVC0_9EURO|nr:hypothetical protein EYZ11_001173 [Aspergillus tanneri]
MSANLRKRQFSKKVRWDESDREYLYQLRFKDKLSWDQIHEEYFPDRSKNALIKVYSTNNTNHKDSNLMSKVTKTSKRPAPKDGTEDMAHKQPRTSESHSHHSTEDEWVSGTTSGSSTSDSDPDSDPELDDSGDIQTDGTAQHFLRNMPYQNSGEGARPSLLMCNSRGLVKLQVNNRNKQAAIASSGHIERPNSTENSETSDQNHASALNSPHSSSSASTIATTPSPGQTHNKMQMPDQKEGPERLSRAQNSQPQFAYSEILSVLNGLTNIVTLYPREKERSDRQEEEIVKLNNEIKKLTLSHADKEAKLDEQKERNTYLQEQLAAQIKSIQEYKTENATLQADRAKLQDQLLSKSSEPSGEENQAQPCEECPKKDEEIARKDAQIEEILKILRNAA